MSQMTFDQFEEAVGVIASGLPDELFKNLNGGIVVRPEVRLHEKSLPERPLYIDGQYTRSSIGRQISLFYGSFMRSYPWHTDEGIKQEIRRVLLHELRHHWEGLAGERDLEIEDEDRIARYEDETKNMPPVKWGRLDMRSRPRSYMAADDNEQGFDPYGFAAEQRVYTYGEKDTEQR